MVDYRQINGVSEELAKGWQDTSIPEKQYALVKQELRAMYEGKPHRGFAVLADALRFTKMLRGSILEIGCSSGYHSEVLSHLLNTPVNYTGIDYSAAFIEMARWLYPAVPFIVGDASCLSLQDACFDVVVSGGVLLHVPDYGTAIRETVRVARDWCVFHRTPISTAAPTTYFAKRAYNVEVVEVIFNEQELLSLFRGSGLELQAEFVVFQSPEVTMKTYVLRKVKRV